jgi:hypothetical protein
VSTSCSVGFSAPISCNPIYLNRETFRNGTLTLIAPILTGENSFRVRINSMIIKIMHEPCGAGVLTADRGVRQGDK